MWAERRNLRGQVTLVVDHGSEASGYWLRERGLGVVFAGPSQKADDVIARDVAYVQSTLGRDVVVVTADRELMRRCHRSAARSGRARLELVPPGNFIEDLERVVFEQMKEREGGDDSEGEDVASTPAPEAMLEQGADAAKDDVPSNELAAEIEQKMEREIRLWGQVVDTEIQLKRRGGSQKKKQKLSKQLYDLKEKLAALNGGPSTLEKVTATHNANTRNGKSEMLSWEMQNDLMSRWEGRRKNSLRAERTGDRVVLAELLRRQLEVISGYDGNDNISDGDSARYPSAAHARYVNVLSGRLFSASTETASELSSMDNDVSGAVSSTAAQAKDCNERSLDPLRMVVISDTHGYETTLTSEGAPLPWDITSSLANNDAETNDIPSQIQETLPDGDVLIHLGDFAVDASSAKKREALQRFDKWLAQQPHRHKIVLRGNHDPFTVTFPLSNSTYIATPQLLDINGWKVGCVPYVTHRRYQVPSGDVLASHIPPKAILDRCESGALAGCSYLRSSVEKMPGNPPKLWLCGHIHESRGHKFVRFGPSGTPETLVVNAANANPGIACALIHGPLVTDLCEESRSEGSGLVIEEAPTASSDFDLNLGRSYLDVEVPEGVGQLLLAVDLGLRMGASLFNDRGEVLRYEQLYFDDADELFEQVPVLLQRWESGANESAESDDGDDTKEWVLTHVAIEGGDVTLLEAWRSAVETDDPLDLPRGGRGARLHTVRPEEWRADLLVKKEKANGRKSKEAARLIARQVVGDFGTGNHEGKFKTDVAEAVTLGFHMSRRLGWIESNVRRATNSMILVPKR